MKIIRWISVLPTSILALVLSSYIVKIIIFIGNFIIPEETTNYDGLVVQSFVAGFNVVSFVMSGAIMAPNKQGLVIKILSLLMMFITFYEGYLLYDIIPDGFENFQWKSFWTNTSLIIISRLLISFSICVYLIYLSWDDND